MLLTAGHPSGATRLGDCCVPLRIERNVVDDRKAPIDRARGEGVMIGGSGPKPILPGPAHKTV